MIFSWHDPSEQLQKFTAKANPQGESEEAYFKRQMQSLEQKKKFLEKLYQKRISLLQSVKQHGASLAKVAQKTAVALEQGASKSMCQSTLINQELLRATDRHLLSLSIAGFAEIEFVFYDFRLCGLLRVIEHFIFVCPDMLKENLSVSANLTKTWVDVCNITRKNEKTSQNLQGTYAFSELQLSSSEKKIHTND